MGLLSTHIDIKINSTNIKYYEKLGYIIPKRIGKKGKLVYDVGNTLHVSINDLQPYSNIKVDVECDCCGKQYKITYGEYTSRNNSVYCCHCVSKMLFSREDSPNWNPNKTDEERENGRKYLEYANFIKRVLARDNYTCRCCGKSHKDLEVHHLDGYDWCVERRTDDTNGITLCKKCHSNFHVTYGSGKNTKEQFEEWYGNAIILVTNNKTILPTRQVYCVEDNKIYDGVLSLKRELGLKSHEYIYNVCNHKYGYHIDKNGNEKEYSKNTINGKHYLWLDEYLTMNKQDILEFLKNKPCSKRRVICTTTNEVFDSIKEASDFYNTNASHISSCCNHKRKSAGKYTLTNKPLKWEYYDNQIYDVKNGLK